MEKKVYPPPENQDFLWKTHRIVFCYMISAVIFILLLAPYFKINIASITFEGQLFRSMFLFSIIYTFIASIFHLIKYDRERIVAIVSLICSILLLILIITKF